MNLYRIIRMIKTMRNFEFKNIIKLTSFDIKNNLFKIIGWSIAVFSIMFLYMILFPSIKDIAQVKIEVMPKELLQFMGMEEIQDMSNFIIYFGMIFNIVLIAISIFAATFSANLICREEKSKSIEFLYSLSVSRNEIYFSKVLTAFIGVYIVVFSAALSTFICGMINGGETFIASDFLQIVKISSFTAFFFITVSFLLAGITTKIGVPVISSMSVLICYMLGYLGTLLGDKSEWLLNFSPFEAFSPTNAINFSNDTLKILAVYLIIMTIFVVSGMIFYKKRDYNI